MTRLYMLNSAVLFLIVGLSYKNEYYLKYIRFALFLLEIRNAVRLIDFERTKAILGQGNWNFLMSIQSLYLGLGLAMFQNVTEDSYLKQFATFTQALFVVVCMYFGVNESYDSFDFDLQKYVP